MYHLEKIDDKTKEIINKCFPSYNGKKIKLSTKIPPHLDSYWDGGSKDSFVFYELSTGKTYSVSTNHPFFERQNPSKLDKLPNGIIIVEHSYFCGKDMRITIYANKSDIAPLLPEKSELSNTEEILLVATSSLKNSYGGETNIRFKRANRKFNISIEDWNNAFHSCLSKGYIKKNGAITSKGRNAIVDTKIQIY